MLNLQQNISKPVSLYNLPITRVLWVKVQNDIRNFQKAASSSHFFPLTAEIFFGFDP